MTRFDRSGHRLFVSAPLAADETVELDPGQTNYVRNVLRLGIGATLNVFNGRDGEWRAVVAEAGRKAARLRAVEQRRPQPPERALSYLFAPLKHARHDYLVQKAVEMGASLLQPVLTRHTQTTRVNTQRMEANVIEAAEQCGILALPEVRPPISLQAALDACQAARLVFCDEEAPIGDPIAALRAAARDDSTPTGLAVLIGPEGGFDVAERAAILRRPHVARLSLGPRILRADTAAVAALALVQSVLGDWGESPLR